ncbi:hypothetical protein [Draconibacterium halophilum]|uniref:Uncharacterized protein n=1 Tax=Draconibacterium halophilum TaxID=2706887 RepID=A0A6C0R8G4_9BACT|nr:hypothetical protein [Draconibacterium halophilum]QIA06459.1 hypothetical protein G0Q07_01360 [Draconibacterium halophilum]
MKETLKKSMKEENKKPTEKENKSENKKDETWIDKAEAKIDETADKIHQSEAYRKADKKLEDTTKKLFRKAGHWWGKNKPKK